ncbi:putative MFS family arabinose efflux permease [Streptomyces sp. T12]|uniref:MFS transporter n=1 Tax=Streptomyces sp. T12 TaxID=477697 RepID=UPI0011A470C6|nr:MFS transporter [Streptomyces sp. T12]TWD17677.1 putative MFS family arabinose efflux permease [Streptomyces sp. T12]
MSSRSRIVLLVVLLGVFSFALMQSLINPVLPQLQQDLGTTPDLITWVVTAFLLSASVFTPILGRMGDRYGKDRMLVLALIALAVGSLVSALATDITLMIVGRSIQGIGGSILPLAFGILRDEMPREKISSTVGLASALVAVGGGIGIVLSGPLSDLLGLRALFWVPMALTALAAVAARLVVPPSPTRSSSGINWISSLLMATWLLALLLPLTQASKWGWDSARVIGLLITAAVLATGWVMTENRSTSPLVDMRMMRLPAVWTTNLVSLLMGMGLYSVFGFMPAFVQSSPAGGYGFDASVTEAGLLLLPMTVTMFFAGLMAVRLVTLLGARTVLAAAAALNAVALTILAFQHDHVWQVIVAMLILGVAFGSAVSTMSNVIVAAVRPDQTGIANGVNANVRTIGGALGAALMGGIISAHLGEAGLPKETGYILGFAALALAALGSVLAAMLIPKPRESDGIRQGSARAGESKHKTGIVQPPREEHDAHGDVRL